MDGRYGKMVNAWDGRMIGRHLTKPLFNHFVSFVQETNYVSMKNAINESNSFAVKKKFQKTDFFTELFHWNIFSNYSLVAVSHLFSLNFAGNACVFTFCRDEILKKKLYLSDTTYSK